MKNLAPISSLRNRLPALLIILAVLGASALLGMRASLTWLGVAAGVVFGAAGVAALLRQPGWGLVGLVAASLALPIELGTGTLTSINPAMLGVAGLLGLWLLGMLLRKEVRLIPTSANWALFALCLASGISLVAGNLPWNVFAGRASLAAQLGGWAVFLLSAGAFWLAANQVREEKWLRGMVWVFLGVSAVYMVGRLVPGLGGLTGLLSKGATGSLFWVWLVALAAGQALFNRQMGWGWRLALGALAAITLLVGWMGRGWASGWVPGAAALLVLIWLRDWRTGLLLSALIAVGMLIYSPSLVVDLVTADQYSIDTRLPAWQIILENVLPANPVFGLGPSNYYFYTPLYALLGYYVKFNSHNQYVDLLAQVGVLGTACFAWAAAALAVTGFRLRRRVQGDFAAGYANAALAGLAGSLAAGMLGDWFLPFVYNIGFAGMRASLLGWLWLGGLAALEHQHKG